MDNKFCINCGKPATCEHHVVPISLGGFDIPSNKVCLCDECHGKIHGIQFGKGNMSHSELIKKGIQKKKEAIARGEEYKPRNHKHSEILIGRPPLTVEQIPQRFMIIYSAKSYTSIKDLAKKCECSRTTVYRYLQLLGRPKMKDIVNSL